MKQSDISRLLPEIFRRTLKPASPLSALIATMEALHAPPEDVLSNLEAYFSAHRAPDAFVSFLAQWIDLAWLVEAGAGDGGEATCILPGLGQLREVIAASAELAHWRGTVQGLTRFMEVATGLTGFRIEEQVPFHIIIHAPAAAKRHEAILERIVQTEKPVYVTRQLAFDA